MTRNYKWKIGDEVVSNLGNDVDKQLTISSIDADGCIWFSDGENININDIDDGDLKLIPKTWKERYKWNGKKDKK